MGPVGTLLPAVAAGVTLSGEAKLGFTLVGSHCAGSHRCPEGGPGLSPSSPWTRSVVNSGFILLKASCAQVSSSLPAPDFPGPAARPPAAPSPLSAKCLRFAQEMKKHFLKQSSYKYQP